MQTSLSFANETGACVQLIVDMADSLARLLEEQCDEDRSYELFLRNMCDELYTIWHQRYADYVASLEIFI